MTPLDRLAAELGHVAKRVEREAGLRLDALIADVRARDAERDAEFAGMKSSFAELQRAVTDRLASLKDGEPGPMGPQGERGLTGERGEVGPRGEAGPQGERGLQGERGEPGERGEKGEKGDPGVPGKDGEHGKDGAPGERGEAGPQGERGEKGDPGAVGEKGAPGERGEPGEPGPQGQKGDAGERGEKGETGERGLPGDRGERGDAGPQGERGPEGRLPVVREWADKVYREGDVVTFHGGTYQANRDTGKPPSHDDWTCLAAPGVNGKDGRSIRIRGTYAEGNDYSELDQVTLNGASFTAKRDNPGPCPGEGWQLSSSQGKSGRPGERGPIGPVGPAGPAVKSIDVDGQGLVTLTNADGSTAEFDLYPLLDKLR